MTTTYSVRQVGGDRQPVVTVDGFHPDPDALRRAALAATYVPGRHHYPGIRAALPAAYLESVRPTLRRIAAEVFGAAGLDLIDASFSIVTTPPAALDRAQRIPHVDAADPARIAMVHYLSPQGGDGTAFYRHRATGFETIDAARGPGYAAMLDRELAGYTPPAAYIAGDTPLFERTAAIDARYNRAVLYRSAMLHSGAIAPDAVLSDDPARGRLTVTAFFRALPA